MAKFIFKLPPTSNNPSPTITYDDPVAFRKAATLACRLLATHSGQPLYYTYISDYSPKVECRLTVTNLGTIQAETLKRTEVWQAATSTFLPEYD